MRVVVLLAVRVVSLSVLSPLPVTASSVLASARMATANARDDVCLVHTLSSPLRLEAISSVFSRDVHVDCIYRSVCCCAMYTCTVSHLVLTCGLFYEAVSSAWRVVLVHGA